MFVLFDELIPYQHYLRMKH